MKRTMQNKGNAISTTKNTPVPGLFQMRPFAMPGPAQATNVHLEQTPLDRSGNFGHSFGELKVNATAPQESQHPTLAATSSVEPTEPTVGALGDNYQLQVAQPSVKTVDAGSTQRQSLRGARGPNQANKTGLPDGLKAGVEHISGHSMDDVKVNYNSSKPAKLQALAYTRGTDIHVGPDQERHLPHEAWHVVQQKEGRVRPTMQLRGVGVNADAALEHEADRMGGMAARVLSNAFVEGGTVPSLSSPQGVGHLEKAVKRV